VHYREDFEQMLWRYNPQSPAWQPDFWKDKVKCYRSRDHPVSLTIPSVFWRVTDWTGLRNLCIMFYRDPDLVCDMMDFYVEFVIRATRGCSQMWMWILLC